MENKIEQNIKGSDNLQQNIVVQGNLNLGLNKEQVLELIKKNCSVDIDKVTEIVKNTIEDIKEKDRVSPTKRIFVPAIQQLSYCLDDKVLQETYRSLLKTSMDKSKNHLVHPAYINIISQLNSDEIKVLDRLSKIKGTIYPVVDLKIKIPNQKGDGRIVLSNFSDIGFNLCDNPLNIGFYIENLERLKLIEIPWTVSFVDKNNYKKIKEHPYIQTFTSNTKVNNVDISYIFDEKIMRLTLMGKNFIKCCTG